jgi:cell wall-associated NlpC family hydrolase
MKLFFLFILGSVLMLASCKSSSSLCKCPYESKIESAPVHYLAVDSSRISLDINVLPILNTSSLLAKQTISALLPVYQNIIDKAFDYKGVRYRRGGTSAKGMDCSGLVYTCFLAYGITLPRSSAAMANSVNDISRNDAKMGDLIFFKTNSRKGRVNHVGLVIGAHNGELEFIHASVHNGVIVSSTTEDYYARRFVKVGRVVRG